MSATLKRWAEAEPLRLYLYTVLAAVVALLIYRGVVTGGEATLWLGLAATVLQVSGVELVRAKVTSPATIRQINTAAGAPTDLTIGRHRALDDEGDDVDDEGPTCPVCDAPLGWVGATCPNARLSAHGGYS